MSLRASKMRQSSTAYDRRREPVAPLEVIDWGLGERVLLVHGSLEDGPATWAHQRPLSERWGLRVVQRRGFGSSPDAAGEDFDHDADDLCELLAKPSHLVAHAYGAIGALIAAARRPRAVLSLTLIEPTCVTAAMDDPRIARAVGFIADWWLHAPKDTAEFLAGYSALLGVRVPELADGPAGLSRAARRLRNTRPPWTADHVRWERIAWAHVPTLVVSGGHSPALDAVAATIARQTAGEHAVIPGAGHTVQRAADEFNPALERHMSVARARDLVEHPA